MGVFSLFRRKTKATEEAAETTHAATPDTATEESDEAKGSPEAARLEAGEDGSKDAAEVADPADDVEIPQQQTAEKAADNEASEGARK